MNFHDSWEIRLAFFRALHAGLRVTWPILSGVLLFQGCLGAVVGLLEGWGVGPGIYFAYVTGLTVGYGDLVPRHTHTRLLAVAIGFSGIVLTGLIAALVVQALHAATHGPKPDEGPGSQAPP